MHCLHQVLSPTHISYEYHTKRTNNEFWMFCRSADSHFELEWREGRVCIRAANGKYVTAKKNGQLAATIDNAGQSMCLMFIKLNEGSLRVKSQDPTPL